MAGAKYAKDEMNPGRACALGDQVELGVAGALAGDADHAAHFTGSDASAIECPRDGAFAFTGHSSFTFEFWFAFARGELDPKTPFRSLCSEVGS